MTFSVRLYNVCPFLSSPAEHLPSKKDMCLSGSDFPTTITSVTQSLLKYSASGWDMPENHSFHPEFQLIQSTATCGFERHFLQGLVIQGEVRIISWCSL